MHISRPVQNLRVNCRKALLTWNQNFRSSLVLQRPSHLGNLEQALLSASLELLFAGKLVETRSALEEALEKAVEKDLRHVTTVESKLRLSKDEDREVGKSLMGTWNMANEALKESEAVSDMIKDMTKTDSCTYSTAFAIWCHIRERVAVAGRAHNALLAENEACHAAALRQQAADDAQRTAAAARLAAECEALRAATKVKREAIASAEVDRDKAENAARHARAAKRSRSRKVARQRKDDRAASPRTQAAWEYVRDPP